MKNIIIIILLSFYPFGKIIRYLFTAINISIKAKICSGYILVMGAGSSVVVKALCYKPEGCRFKTR
jgi:hypothetical protein